MRGFAIFLPQHHQADTGTLQLACQARPVRFGKPPEPGLLAAWREQPTLQHLVGQIIRQRPGQPRHTCPAQIVLDRAARNPQHTTDLPRAHPFMGKPQQVPYLPHRQPPFGRHIHPPSNLSGDADAQLLTR